jgi:hypothetical protein
MPASAVVNAQSNASKVEVTSNTDDVICEKIEVIGSRLAVKRVCMKRSEWAERRLQDRQEVEKAHTTRSLKPQ